MSYQGEPHGPRLGRVEVVVVLAGAAVAARRGSRIAPYPRAVEILDVVRRSIKEIQDIEGHLRARGELVRGPPRPQERRSRALLVVLGQRPRAEVAHEQASRPWPEILCRDAEGRHPVDRARN